MNQKTLFTCASLALASVFSPAFGDTPASVSDLELRIPLTEAGAKKWEAWLKSEKIDTKDSPRTDVYFDYVSRDFSPRLLLEGSSHKARLKFGLHDTVWECSKVLSSQTVMIAGLNFSLKQFQSVETPLSEPEKTKADSFLKVWHKSMKDPSSSEVRSAFSHGLALFLSFPWAQANKPALGICDETLKLTQDSLTPIMAPFNWASKSRLEFKVKLDKGLHLKYKFGLEFKLDSNGNHKAGHELEIQVDPPQKSQLPPSVTKDIAEKIQASGLKPEDLTVEPTTGGDLWVRHLLLNFDK